MAPGVPLSYDLSAAGGGGHPLRRRFEPHAEKNAAVSLVVCNT